MKDCKILVACNTLDYMLVQKILSDSFQLDWVTGMEEILQKSKETDYDLFLLDVCFLKKDNTLLSQLRMKDPVSVIAISSEPFDARDQKLQESGCSACYIKPIRQTTFKTFVNYWLRHV